MLKSNYSVRRALSLNLVLAVTTCLPFVSLSPGAEASSAPKTVIDYFLPMPIFNHLYSDKWGCAAVGKRDIYNGLEDTTMLQYSYWDGQIIKGPDGRFHMFASRWNQTAGHNGWSGSVAVHAVSNAITGPYVDKGLCWPSNQGGKGHNVTALRLADGTHACLVSDTRPGDFFTSSSLDGPWTFLGSIKINANGYAEPAKTNLSIMIRPDNGYYEIVPRSGQVMISSSGLLGPYVVQGNSVYSGINLPNLEDPVVWYSGGLYHIVVNSWSTRQAIHLTSSDGIRNWTNRGLAYDPTRDFLRYSDGTVNHWNKIERPGVVIENGHVTHFTFAVIDVPKEQDLGNDTHGSKILVVPFDGAALDPPSGAKISGQGPDCRQKPAIRCCLQKNALTISVRYRSAYELRIMQANGRIVKTIRDNTAAAYTFSRRELECGVYYIIIAVNQQMVFKKVVIY
jgi:hypothetical protein